MMIYRKCCPLWVIVTVALSLITTIAIVVCILKKLQFFGRKSHVIQDGCCHDKCDCNSYNENEDENGVRYTTEKDFE